MEPTPPTPPPIPPPPPSPPAGWPPSVPATQRFSTGAVLGETFAVFFSSIVPLVITALIMVPFGLLALAIVKSIGDPTMAQAVDKMLGLVQNLVISPLATAAIVYAVFQRMRGREVEVGDAIRVGFSKLGLVVGVAILQGLATLAGLIFCIVPGLIVATMLAVSVPVAVEEPRSAGTGAGSVLSRSSELTEGHRWSVFFVFLCLILLAMGAGIVVGLVAGISSPGNTLLIEIVSLPLVVVATGLSATASTVMYYRLRSVKESLDVDQIASVFD
jgi:hypothetical protein